MSKNHQQIFNRQELATYRYRSFCFGLIIGATIAFTVTHVVLSYSSQSKLDKAIQNAQNK